MTTVATEWQNALAAESESLDTMFKNEEKISDSDLKEMVKTADYLLLQAKQNSETSSENNCEKNDPKVEDKFKKISTIFENNIDTAAEVLETVGKCHWAAAGFVLVAAVLKKFGTVKRNRKECLRLIKSMNDLAKIVLELQPLPHETFNTQAKVKESIHTILKGAMSCVKVIKTDSVVNSDEYKEELSAIRREIEELRSILHVHISVCIFKWLCKNGKDYGGMKHSDTDTELDNEEDLNERSPKKVETYSNESTDPTQISRTLMHQRGFKKRSHSEASERTDIEFANSPQTPSPSKLKKNPEEAALKKHKA